MTSSERDYRLFACRCVREIEHLLLDPRSIRAIEVAELFANGAKTPEELQRAAMDASAAAGEIAMHRPGGGRALAAEAAVWTADASAAKAASEAPKLAARAAASERTAGLETATREARQPFFDAEEKKARQRQAKIRADM